MSRSPLRSFLPLATPRRLIPPAALILVALGLLALAWAGRSLTPAQAAPNDCSTGNVPDFIETDTTFEGDLYVTDNVTIRDGAALTLTAGTNVTMCGPYQIWVQDARLLALGTEADPVTVTAQDPNTPWRRIYIGGGGIAVQQSVLRHLILEDGGHPPNTDTTDTGAIEIYSPDPSVEAGPVLDHVTVRNSRRYGIDIRMDEHDPDPLSLTNLTVTGSAQAPLMLYVSAMRGLGDGHTFTDNGEDVIEVRAGTVGGGVVHFDQRWLAHDVPYKVVSAFGGITLSGDNDPILTIDPGATLLMDEGTDIRVISGGLVAEGTADAPITFTRPDETSLPWERILIDDRFSESESSLSHVNVSYAGHVDGAIYLQEGALSIDNATIQNNSGPGVTANNSFVEIVDSTIDSNDVGVDFRNTSRGVLRRNTLTNNTGGAVVNDNSDAACVDAMGNYWGSPDGPADPSAELDDCNLTATNAGSGDAVSDNVLYDPWLTAPPADAAASTSSLSPDPFWVLANGADSANLTITLRDADGNPLPGKEITLQTTRGVIQQPSAPTDQNGIATAVITSTETGGAIITARNVTDGEPLAALAAVYFWQGYEESAGLVDPGGVPYVAPQLQMDGQPFEEGFPMTFRLPMQNGNPVEATVVVTYSVSGLGIGARFTPVDVITRTLAPAEAWDAEAEWIPDVTGHHCVRATASVTLPDSPANAPAINVVNVGPWQINFDLPEDPCKEIDVNKLVPNSAGLSGARKHVTRGVVQAHLANACINSHLGGGTAALSPAQATTSHRAYEEIVSPLAYTPPPLEPGDGVTPEHADAANTVVEAAFRLAALGEARLVTAERIRAAGQAGDDQAVARQREAYSRFHRDYADELEIYADAIDAFLAVTGDENIPDTTFMPADYQAYLNDIQNGYDAETIAFHQAAGLPPAAIETIRQAEIARFEEQPPTTVTFYRFLSDVAGAARRLALELENDYVIVGAGRRAAPMQTGPDDPLHATFTVGNPTGSSATIDLLVRPVDVPLNWSYTLDNPAPTLDPGETTTVTLTINPAGGQATGRTVQLAVEGFIRDDYVGGVLFERSMDAVRYDLHLPAVLGE